MLPKDIDIKIDHLFTSSAERQEVKKLLADLFTTSLNVGPAQLSRSILTLSDGKLTEVKNIIEQKFFGDPRDIIMMAEKKAGNPEHYFIPSFDEIENNMLQKTLESLENDVWSKPPNDSHLVTRCFELREIPLEKFTIEDLRIMIGQQMSLDLLVPLAINALGKDLFAEGDFFEGDLLKNVLLIKTEFWNNNKVQWLRFYDLIKNRREEISEKKFETTAFDLCKHQQGIL